MLLLREKLYIFDLISFQYFLVDVWKPFIMFNELAQSTGVTMLGFPYLIIISPQ